MNNRLQQFLSAENLSQAQLAEMIGVARASVSHIIAGRNKPGFDFIEGMISHFPNLNINWLITGKGKMYNSSTGLFAKEEPEKYVPDSLFQESEPAVIEEVPPTQLKEDLPIVEEKPSSVQRKIAKVIVFYDDNTFQELG